MKRLLRKSVTLDVKVRQRHEYRLGQKAYDTAVCSSGEIVGLLGRGAVLLRFVWSNEQRSSVETVWFVPWCNLRPSSDPKWL